MSENGRASAARIFLAAAVTVACVLGAGRALAQSEVSRAVDELDDVRALAMRALMRAQDLKLALSYGQGYGLNARKSHGEDVLIEGLWLFDYVHSMDGTAMSLIGYYSAAEHPNLDEELKLFREYVGEAARRTLEYYDRVSRMLNDVVADVNRAAARQAAFRLETIPAQPWSDDPSVNASAGDGFNIGLLLPAIHEEGSMLGRHLTQHGHSQQRLFELARRIGIDFVSPEDRNLFDWADVERLEGNYDWARIDRLLAVYKKYGMALWLPLPSYNTSPPEWLRERLKDDTVLTAADGTPLSIGSRGRDTYIGINDFRETNNPLNLFNPAVSKPFARFIGQLITHVKNSGVPIMAVQLGDDRTVPFYAGPSASARWQAWLEKNKIDPRTRWNMDIDIKDAGLPDKMETGGVTERGRRRLLLDLARWREDEYVEYFRVQVDAIRAVMPEVPICTQSCDRGERNESMNGRPNERLIRELGLMPYSNGNGANLWDDLRRAYSPAHWSAGRTANGSGDTLAQYGFSAYMHGTFTIVSKLPPLLRALHWRFAFAYPDVRLQSSAYYGWRRFHERAQGMAPEMINTRLDAQVAMLWSDTANKFHTGTWCKIGTSAGSVQGLGNFHKVSCLGWGRVLDSISLAHDVVTESHVRQGRLQQYKLLILPAVQALPADIVQKIREFVKDGGCVVASSVPALYGDDMQRKGGGQLADVFGAEFDRFFGESVIPKTPMGISVGGRSWVGQNRSTVDARIDTLRTLYCTFKVSADATVMMKFTTGDPAVIINKIGKGKALLIGYPVGREVFMSDRGAIHNGTSPSGRQRGSGFTQTIVAWFEMLLPEFGLLPRALVDAEYVPRGPITWDWTRYGRGYRDYGWDRDYEPRSVEVGIRKREGNPNIYLTIFNREGGGGSDDPGVIHFQATSKELRLQLRLGEVKQIYDLSLGCAVPFTQTRVAGAKPLSVVNFGTMLEPSAARMLVIATEDDVIRLYEGNRSHGLDDAALRENVAGLAGAPPPPQIAVIGLEGIMDFLAQEGPKGMAISAESPTYVSAAKRLAAAFEKAFGKKARVTRNSPRVAMPHNIFIDRPNVFLGSHNESHYISFQRLYWDHAGPSARLPIVTSHTFPGDGRSVIVLWRPYYRRQPKGDEEKQGRVLAEDRITPQLFIGASGNEGLNKGVDHLIELIRQHTW